MLLEPETRLQAVHAYADGIIINMQLDILLPPPVVTQDGSPVSMRRSALRDFGVGGSMYSLYDSRRFENACYRSRGIHRTKKDKKAFLKPWQINPRIA